MKIPPKLVDFVERVGATFFQTFLALSVVTGLANTQEWKAAAVAGALAAGKYAVVAANSYLQKSPEVPTP